MRGREGRIVIWAHNSHLGVYRPESERASHYFDARLGEEFDAVFHLDETAAVEPLDIHERWVRHEAPETYPFGV